MDRHFLCFIMGPAVFDEKDECLVAEKRKREREREREKKKKVLSLLRLGDGCNKNKALFGFCKEWGKSEGPSREMG